MKVSDKLKFILIERVSREFLAHVSAEDFNQIFKVLERKSLFLKAVPFGVFETPEIAGRLQRSKEGDLFWEWLQHKTSNIEKPFNKGRKLSRIFRDFISEYGTTLPYTLSAGKAFSILLTSLFLGNEEYKDSLEEGVDYEQFLQSVTYLKGYLSVILYLDSINETPSVESVLHLFISGDTDDLIQTIVTWGQKNGFSSE